MSVHRGWCPSLHEPMPSGDGLLVRIKPRAGAMPAASVMALARGSVRYGNGILDLTRRAAVQVRGLTEATVPGFAAEMIAAGLAVAEAGAERRRNVIATPLAGADPDVHPESGAVTAALEAALECADDLACLSAKVGVAVDGGGTLALGDVDADIGVALRGAEAVVTVAGGASAATVPAGQGATTVMRLLHACASLGGGRVRAIVAEHGEAALFAGAGLQAVAVPPTRGAREAVGVHRYAGGCAIGAGLAFGSAPASVWAALAALAAEFGDGVIRLTPWRALLIAGVREPTPLLARIEAAGLVVAPGDPRLQVSACPGAPGCASASVATRTLAARLRPAPGMTVHVSGCDKGCAHPRAAAVTLVGRAGRFDLVRDGRAGDPPVRLALEEAEVLAL